ncbi:Pre-mRNA-processing factor [Salix suchowensis]|nr:Pre-mRNA-processing factor [Salix suchowensis]
MRKIYDQVDAAMDVRSKAGFRNVHASGLSNSIDTWGYLTSIDSASVMLKTSAEFGDIKRARMLFDSLVKSNPKHAPGWIAAACLEEHAGRMVAARKTIMQGCEMCPKSEDIWLEAAGLDVCLHTVLLMCVSDITMKNNNDAKQTVNLETSVVDTRILLSRAVEVIPVSVDLWLALARLETPEKAKAVLNRALNGEPVLEQRAKELETVDKTIEAGVRGLRRHQVLLTREQWLKEAEKCESGGSRRACEAIVKACIGMGLEDSEGDRNAMGEEEKLDVWLGDAEAVESRGKMGTARAVIAYALRCYPGCALQNLRRLTEPGMCFDFCGPRNDQLKNLLRESLETILERAVHHCPHVEVLWLMAAKEKWLSNTSMHQCGPASYAAGLKVCPKVIPLWILASRLEEKDGKSIKARCLMEKARLVNPANDELWAEAVHVEERAAITSSTTQAQAQAKAMLARGLQECPTSGVLWSANLV